MQNSIFANQKVFNDKTILLSLLGLSILFILAKIIGILPEFLNRVPEYMIPQYAETLDQKFNNNRDWMTSITRFFSQRLEFQLKVMAHLFYGARVHFFNPIDWLSLLLPATALVYFIDGRKVAFVTAAIISATAIIFTFLMNEDAQLMYMWLFLGLSAIGCTYAFIKYSFISPFFIFGAVSIYALILNGYKLGPLPWSSVAATAAVIGYYLGGWRLALLGGGTFIWTALIGQWKLAMETLSADASLQILE